MSGSTNNARTEVEAEPEPFETHAQRLIHLTSELGDEIEDPDEEVALVFSQPIPSHNLGFVDSQAETLELSISGKDFVIRQSPAVLKSNLKGGTTGAVVWKVTPKFASWLSNSENILFRSGILGPHSTAVELGTGTSGLVSLVLAPKISKYVATDQQYALKLLTANIKENTHVAQTWPSTRSRTSRKGTSRIVPLTPSSSPPNFDVVALDWEEDSVLTLRSYLEKVDAVLACDCIYNESLVDPFVDTCAELCRHFQAVDEKPAICVVAQQLRSPLVFEAWLHEFHRYFRVWRIPDGLLSDELQGGNGFVIHMGILRERYER